MESGLIHGLEGLESGDSGPEVEVSTDVIRNFRKKDDRYEWLRKPREADEEREESVVEAIEAVTLIEQSVDDDAELAARLRYEAAREQYLKTFEAAYREAYREELINQWLDEIAMQKHAMAVRHRAAFLLLLAH